MDGEAAQEPPSGASGMGGVRGSGHRVVSELLRVHTRHDFTDLHRAACCLFPLLGRKKDWALLPQIPLTLGVGGVDGQLHPPKRKTAALSRVRHDLASPGLG